MSTRRKKFTASIHFEPGGAATIQEAFCSIATRIQGAISTETPCTIRIAVIVTTDPTPAEIEKHVSRPEQYHQEETSMDPLKEKVLHIEPIDFQPRAPTGPKSTIGTKIQNKYTGEQKTIERVETVGAAHIVYITTDGVRYDTESLRAHWTVVQSKKAPLRAGLKRAASNTPPG